MSCPTLCDPIDCSPPGSPVSGILQARTLEWVAISFSNAWKWKVKVKSLSRAAYQVPPPMGFSRQEYWSRVTLSLSYFGLSLQSSPCRKKDRPCNCNCSCCLIELSVAYSHSPGSIFFSARARLENGCRLLKVRSSSSCSCNCRVWECIYVRTD